jgi:hypothetical protein
MINSTSAATKMIIPRIGLAWGVWITVMGVSP